MELINTVEYHCCVTLSSVKCIDILHLCLFLSAFFFPWYDLVSSFFMPFVLNSVFMRVSFSFLSLRFSLCIKTEK